MRSLAALLMTLLAASAAAPALAADEPPDPWLWLEDVSGERALDWVRARNARAEQAFDADPRFEPLRKDILAVLDSRERIPLVERMGAHWYNLWRDAANPRGLWRRTSLDEYREREPTWEVVLDLDALGRAENENWVFKGAECLRPARAGQPYRHCLIALSRGGADAVVVREFDLVTRSFVQNGFALPEAKQDLAWRDRDTLWVASDFGPGSLTTSGYPRIVKLWKRGTPISAARTVLEGQAADVAVSARSERESGARRDWLQRAITFWQSEHYVLRAGRPVRLDLPLDALVDTWRDWLLVRTRSSWTLPAAAGERSFPAGALLAIRFDAFVKGSRAFDLLYAPTARSSIDEVKHTRSAVLVAELDNVRPRLWEFTHDGKAWRRSAVALPDTGTLASLTTYWASDEYLLTHQDFTTPTTLLRRQVGRPDSEPLKALPTFFDARGIVTRQYEATSRDGTRIPYFVALREDTALDGRNPTLLYGYGGFEIPMLPWYSGNFGRGWLEPGGVLVLANLRGGGEFGPAWHQAAIKENKQRTWDDFAAVAEDLVRRGITSPARLGIMGGSQGGLLVTAAMVQRPELFGAVVAQVPLVDMLRYHRLPAGASWIAEYGDPDLPAERAWLARWSPYQNVRKDAKYPPIFLVTSTRDDRVHPGHARKMAARMLDQGHDVRYYENIEGGHGGAADNAQSARMWAQAFTFLWQVLGR